MVCALVGGNGYVEDWPMASLFRQSPLNAIWEGSGNVICLDVLRAASREPKSVIALFAELDRCSDAAPSQYIRTVDTLRAALLDRTPAQLQQLESGARALVDCLAVCLQAATLLQNGDPVVATAFIATRLCEAQNGIPAVPHNVGAVAGSVLSPDVIDALLARLHVTTSDSRSL